MSPTFEELSVGQDIGARSIDVTRQDLVKYAGASGDFNPIHWNEAFATGVELPGVIAHGMFTMGAAVQLVSDWAGDPPPSSITRPASPSRYWWPTRLETGAAGALIEVTGAIGALDAEARTARVDLAVVFDGQKVLVKAQALVKVS